jgi:hypothetical protein
MRHWLLASLGLCVAILLIVLLAREPLVGAAVPDEVAATLRGGNPCNTHLLSSQCADGTDPDCSAKPIVQLNGGESSGTASGTAYCGGSGSCGNYFASIDPCGN